MKISMRCKMMGALLSGCGLAVLPFPVMAQDASADLQSLTTSSEPEAPSGQNDIVVTALKRETSVQNTPIAITAVTGNTLAAMNITDSASLARVSPGLVVRESNFTGSRLTIRNIRAAGEPTAGLYYDETPLIGSAGVTADAGGTTPDIRLFDVERVEVLRGPQGTLYGSSSMAGTVRLVFAKPDLSDAEGSFNGKMMGVENGDLGFETQAVLNVPLITGALGVRAVGFYQNRPGYIDNTRLNRDNANDQVSHGGRVMVRLKPALGVTIDALMVLQDIKGEANDYQLTEGAYNRTYETQQPISDKFRLYSGTLNWDVGPVTLTAIGSHTYRNFNYSYDFSAFFRARGAAFPVGSPSYLAINSQAPAVANSPQITKTDTAEIRLSTSENGPVQFTGGFFYSNRNGDSDSNIVRADPATGAMLPINAATLLGQRIITDKLKQTAGFAEITYDITDRLSVTGGIRYFHYDRRVTGDVTKPNPLVGFIPGLATDQSSSENGWLYKANVSYKLADRILVYATASSGARPGGVNQAVGLPASLQTYESDRLWNYEAGVKSQLFDRMLTFNASVFQINWDDIQTQGTLPSTVFAFIANASKARIRGVEVEATLVPLEGLQLQASGSYIDGHLTEDQASPDLAAPGLKGDPIPQVPKTTLQSSIQYSWQVDSGLKAVLRADGYYNGVSWINFRHTNALTERLPAYATLGLRAGISGANDDWSASIFANNVTNNDAAVTKPGSNGAYGGQVRGISLTPRTIGIEFSKRF